MRKVNLKWRIIAIWLVACLLFHGLINNSVIKWYAGRYACHHSCQRFFMLDFLECRVYVYSPIANKWTGPFKKKCWHHEKSCELKQLLFLRVCLSASREHVKRCLALGGRWNILYFLDETSCFMEWGAAYIRHHKESHREPNIIDLLKWKTNGYWNGKLMETRKLQKTGK